MSRTVFTSNNSFGDAEWQARNAGYEVKGKARNQKTGQFIVFASPRPIRRYI